MQCSRPEEIEARKRVQGSFSIGNAVFYLLELHDIYNTWHEIIQQQKYEYIAHTMCFQGRRYLIYFLFFHFLGGDICATIG